MISIKLEKFSGYVYHYLSLTLESFIFFHTLCSYISYESHNKQRFFIPGLLRNLLSQTRQIALTLQYELDSIKHLISQINFIFRSVTYLRVISSPRTQNCASFLCDAHAAFPSRVHHMQRSGLIQIFRQRSNPRKVDKTEINFSSVSVYQITPLLGVMAHGVLLSVILLIMERLSVWKEQQRSKYYKN